MQSITQESLEHSILSQATEQLVSICWRQYCNCWSLITGAVSAMIIAIFVSFGPKSITTNWPYVASSAAIALSLIALGVDLYFARRCNWVLTRNKRLGELSALCLCLNHPGCWIAKFGEHLVEFHASTLQAKLFEETIRQRTKQRCSYFTPPPSNLFGCD